jgi:cytochrome c553
MSANRVIAGRLAAATITGVGVAWFAHAEAQSGSRQPDTGRGAVVAAQGTAAGVPACAQCHAFNGSSDGSGAFPRLAGLSSYYLEKELRDFASGVRANAVMTPVAKALSPDDAADVASYYAGVDGPFLPLPRTDPALVARGERLAKVGDAARELQSCDNCHGPGGAGEPPTIPYLAGQYGHYITFELQMWRHGFRKNSPHEMAEIAGRLDDQDIAAVAAYYQQVREPPQTVPTRESSR